MRKTHRTKRVAPCSYNERQRLKNLIAEDERYLKGFARAERGVGGHDVGLRHQEGRSIDSGPVRDRIKRHQRALERLSPENNRITKSGEKNRAWKRIKEIQGWMRGHMLTKREMGAFPSADNPAKHQRYVQACDKTWEQEAGDGKKAREFKSMAQELKSLARCLDPDSPDLANLELLRPATRIAPGRGNRNGKRY